MDSNQCGQLSSTLDTLKETALPHVYSWLKTNHPKIAKKLAKAGSWEPTLTKEQIAANAAQLDALLAGAYSADEITSESESDGEKTSAKSLKRKAESSTASSDDEEEQPATKKVIKSVIAVVEDAPLESSAPLAKKAKIAIDADSGTATVTTEETAQTNSALKIHPDRQQQRASTKKANVPFRRVKAEEVNVDARLQDNSYAAKGGVDNDFGAKASRDLIVTRGDKFRKEKGKKKRGSYRGGDITLESHSIKFDD